METLLQDLWTEMQSYYDQMVALLPRLLLALLVFVLLWLLAWRVRVMAKKILTRRMDDPLLASFLSRVMRWVILTVAFLLFLNIVGLGKTAGGLLASAGVGAFIIGFAFKDIGENLLAGIMLAFKRPFKLGDLVQTGDVKGKVVRMSLRDTQVKTAEGVDVFVPNATIIKQPLHNYTVDGDLRLDFVIGIDYGADPAIAENVVLEAMAKVPGIMQAPRPPVVAVKDLGASSLNLVVYFWIDAFDPEVSGIRVRKRAITYVLNALTMAGVYLPGDIMEVKNYQETEVAIKGGG